jgi:predicted aspartyl protease
MPHLTLPLSPSGCLVDLYVGVSEARRNALAAAKLPIPEVIRVHGLIDTGASCTVIDANAIASLQLTPTGSILVHTPSTGANAAAFAQYDVLLSIYHPTHSLVIGTIPIVTSDLAATGIQALIGRDVLAKCLLVYDGVASHFSLAF